MQQVYPNSGFLRGVFVASLCLFAIASFAQPHFNWANHSGGAGLAHNYNVKTDKEGDIIKVGCFRGGEIDFDPGPGTCVLFSFNTKFSLYIQKLSFDGTFCWAKRIGYFDIFPLGFDVDSLGNICIFGEFAGTMDFDPGPGTCYLSADTNFLFNHFILKLTKDGLFVWAKKLEGAVNYSGYDTYQKSALKISDSNNIIISERFWGLIDFDPGPASYWMDSDSGSNFVLKLTSDGNFLWAFQTGDTGINWDDHTSGFCMDSIGNMYLMDDLTGTADFDPGPGVYNLSGNISHQRFIAKYDNNTNLLWAITLPLNYQNHGSMTVNPAGVVFVSGFFSDTIDLNPGPGVHELYPLPGAGSTFFLKLTTDGNFVWASQIDSLYGYVNTSACDAEGYLYVCGGFKGTVDFDPGPNIYNMISPPGNLTGFILKLGQEGGMVWATSHLVNSNYSNWGFGLSLDLHHNITISGNFHGTADFDPDTSTYNMTGISSQDIFTQRLWQCPPAAATLNLEACQHITLNGETYYNSGTFSQFLTSTEGCDSILTLNLNIHHINPAVLQSGITLTAADTTLNYQWVDCDNGFSPIAGQNGLSFTPTANGHYAVIIDDGFCSDTSACVEITTVGIHEMAGECNFRISPNPGNGTYSIAVDFVFSELYLDVFDIYGRHVESKIIHNSESLTFNINAPPGMYFVTLATQNKTYTSKLLKY